MTRSDRFLEAVRALEDWRYEQKAKAPDLFSLEPASASDEWRDQALELVHRVALTRTELPVEDLDWPAAYDNRSRGWAMQHAAREGWFKPLGWVNGNSGRRGRPVRLWASQIYDAGGAN